MANLCSNSQYHGCPASFYLKCSGYRKGLNCWEIEQKPCCPINDPAKCKSCKVYLNCNSGTTRTVEADQGRK